MSQPGAQGGRATSRSASVGAFLSFVWPGLGQWYAGRRRTAALFALPPLAALVAIGLSATAGVEQLAALLITPSSALTIFILIVLLGIWRVVAIVDATARVGSGRRGRGGTTVALVALVAVVATHGWVGYVAWSGYEAASRIFVGQAGPDATPSPAGVPAIPSATDDRYLATPIATPPTPASRINILLTGVDSAESRTTELTDTLLVASVDPTTHHVALISFPRDISHFPLYDGRTFRGKLNGLMTWAENHPAEFPDGGLQTLIRELGFLLGAPIHYYAAVDLEGFRRLIDKVGGVTIDNARAIDDRRYDWLDGTYGFRLAAGRHTLDGRTALAYVRSRYSPGDNDFGRARRQQQVLLALRDKLASPDALPMIPDLLRAAGDTIRTNFPADRIDEMLAIARSVDTDDALQVILGPPYAFHPPTETTGGIYTLRLDLERVAELSVRLFGEQSAYAGA